MKKKKSRNIISIDDEKCNGCMNCIPNCPYGLISTIGKITKSGHRLIEFKDNGTCTACTLCALVCPEAAIEIHASHQQPAVSAGPA